MKRAVYDAGRLADDDYKYGEITAAADAERRLIGVSPGFVRAKDEIQRTANSRV